MENTPTIRLWHGNCLDRISELGKESVVAVITDPPYDIAFMAHEWDDQDVLKNTEIWRACYDALVPGGVIKAFSASRTYHRIFRSLSSVGFRDLRLEAWGYSSGFPKSRNISLQIDKSAGAEREVIGYKRGVGGENMNDIVNGKAVRQTTDAGGKGVGAYGTGAKQVAVDVPITAPATELAKLWDGYGTALKIAWEPIAVGRKPG